VAIKLTNAESSPSISTLVTAHAAATSAHVSISGKRANEARAAPAI
jgi:V8-like Glu-specific endopeptidase